MMCHLLFTNVNTVNQSAYWGVNLFLLPDLVEVGLKENMDKIGCEAHTRS